MSKTNVCHNGFIIKVSQNSIDAHLEHGDFLFRCDIEETDSGIVDSGDPQIPDDSGVLNDSGIVLTTDSGVEDASNSLDDSGTGTEFEVDLAEEEKYYLVDAGNDILDAGEIEYSVPAYGCGCNISNSPDISLIFSIIIFGLFYIKNKF